MAGESTLPVEQYPDDFQILSFPFGHTLDGADNTIPLFYADRILVIDSIVFGVASVQASLTAQLQEATTPQAASGTALHTAQSMATAGTYSVSPSTSANTISAGNWVILKFSAATTAVHGCVTIRVRSRQK